jgi:hypothetical protein
VEINREINIIKKGMENEWRIKNTNTSF